MTADTAASVKARLLNLAKSRREELELFLVRYASERFLYRLGASEVRDRFVLKGASLLALWMDDPYRSTRDVDLLAQGSIDEARIRDLMATICAVPCSEDGLRFELQGLDVSPMRADQEHQGMRAVLRAFLGKARIRVQIDFGFGDSVTPGPEESEYPVLLAGIPAPRLRAYSREVTVAEKFEAMVQLGRRNSRMKDFHDIWALSSAFAFDGPVLRQAVVACFERRRTPWTPERPDALSSAFYGTAEMQTRWSGYLRAGAFHASPPASFESIGEEVRQFLEPLRASIAAGDGFERRWAAGGPWR